MAISHSITKPLQRAMRSSQKMATCDLSEPVVVGCECEVGHLLRNMENLRTNVADLVLRVRDGASDVAQTATVLAGANQALRKKTSNLESALLETNFSLDNLRQIIHRNSELATEANNSALNASEVARQGGEEVNKVVGTMTDISASSRRIGDIIGTIDAIAFQTNLLALNAAVEAARAGPQGKGLAVVATEVRALAARVAAAAGEVRKLVAASVEQVGVGVQVVDNTGTTITSLVGTIDATSSKVREIHASGAQQFSGVDEVASAVGQIDRATEENADVVSDMDSTARELEEKSTHLLQMVSVFKLNAQDDEQVLPVTNDDGIVEF